MEKIMSIFPTVFLTLCVIAMSICFVVMIILSLSRYSAFFMKTYLYIFERGDYEIYKEAKALIKD